jgi:exopolysaccharide biosynthesis polyprenyl glycosylphosphotransferase
MLKENWRFIARLERLGDFLIVLLTFLVAYYARPSLIYWNDFFDLGFHFERFGLAPIKDYFIILFVAATTTLAYLQLRGAYGSMRYSSSFRLLVLFISCSLFVFFALAASLFLLKINLSRSFIILFCILLALFLTAERIVVLHALRFMRRQGLNYRNVLLLGTGKQALKLAKQITERPEIGIRINALAELDAHFLENNNSEYKAIKELIDQHFSRKIPTLIVDPKSIEDALHRYAIDEVIITNFVNNTKAVEEVISFCAEQGVRTTIAADLFSMGLVKSGISFFGDIPLIHFQTPPGDRWELVVKRWVDVLLSTLLIIILSPLLLVIALAVKLSSRGPVFFVQQRVGLNGRVFKLYKFRSMYNDAESQLDALRSKNEMQGPVFKLTSDPRITNIGQWLRRYSLDELPQLWNVIKGDMSLVGPRPPIPGEVKAYERRYRRRLSMRPGITCTWQVSGRNEIKCFESWVKLDLDYIDNWSLQKDLLLLFKTIPAVILGIGAR